jgi:hypothetical protein
VAGITEGDEFAFVEPDRHLTRTALGGLEVGRDVVGAQLEVARVCLVAEPVVGHRQVFAGLTPGDDAGEPDRRLRRCGERDPVDRLTGEERARRWAKCVYLGRQDGPALEDRTVATVIVELMVAPGVGCQCWSQRQECGRGADDAEGSCAEHGITSVS